MACCCCCDTRPTLETPALDQPVNCQMMRGTMGDDDVLCVVWCVVVPARREPSHFVLCGDDGRRVALLIIRRPERAGPRRAVSDAGLASPTGSAARSNRNPKEVEWMWWWNGGGRGPQKRWIGTWRWRFEHGSCCEGRRTTLVVALRQTALRLSPSAAGGGWCVACSGMIKRAAAGERR